MPDLPVEKAIKLLEKIQHRDYPTAMDLMGVPGVLTPLDQNAFRFEMTMAYPGAAAAARRLNDVGAELDQWPPVPMGNLKAVLTWDTALHGLIVPQLLKEI